MRLVLAIDHRIHTHFPILGCCKAGCLTTPCNTFAPIRNGLVKHSQPFETRTCEYTLILDKTLLSEMLQASGNRQLTRSIPRAICFPTKLPCSKYDESHQQLRHQMGPIFDHVFDNADSHTSDSGTFCPVERVHDPNFSLSTSWPVLQSLRQTTVNAHAKGKPSFLCACDVHSARDVITVALPPLRQGMKIRGTSAQSNTPQPIYQLHREDADELDVHCWRDQRLVVGRNEKTPRVGRTR